MLKCWIRDSKEKGERKKTVQNMLISIKLQIFCLLMFCKAGTYILALCSGKLRIKRFPDYKLYRSSHPEVFCKKGVLRNFAKLTGEHLCQSLCTGLACKFINKEALAEMFSCEFCEVSKNSFSLRTPPVVASELLTVLV